MYEKRKFVINQSVAVGDLQVTGDLSSFIVVPLTCKLNILSVSKAAL